MISIMLNTRRVALAILCAILFGSLALLGGPVGCNAQTTWNNVAIGGGGYITGVVYDPKATGVIYSHADVGGAYKWNANTNSWTPLLDWLTPSQSNWQGVESIAIDTSDLSGNTVYAAVGEYSIDWASPSHGDILKSTNGGQTWTATGLGTGYQSSLVDFAGVGIGSNWTQGFRERLVIDPNDNQILFYASAGFGLWESTNAAASWQRVASAPVGDTTGIGQTNGAIGVVWAAIDPTSGSSGSQSKTIYLGVPGTSSQSFAGVWVSTNGGLNWSLLTGGPLSPQQGVVGADGTLYVTHTSGVAKYKSGVWTNITPVSGQGYGAIAIDPFNPQRLMTNGFYFGLFNPLYLSTNGGTSWTTLNNTYQSVATWWPTDFWAGSVSSINFDPFVQDTVTYSDYYGVWKTTAISAANPNWTNLLTGDEETVTLALTSPTSGPELVSGAADVGGFSHASLTQYPTDSFGLDLNLDDVTGLDFSETTPSFFVAAGGNRNVTIQASVAYSTNSGAAWTPLNNTASIGQNGRVAVSATNTSKIIWLPPGASPEYTTTRGSSWNTSTGGSAALPGSGPFMYSQPLAADRVNGSYAYLYDANTGDFYSSSNFGASWTLSPANLPAIGAGNVTVEAAPGLAGNVWLEVAGSGVYASTNYGQSFTQISAVSSPEFFSFGAPQQTGGTPTAYVLGIVSGTRGVYRSVDLGANWTRIDTSAVGFAQPTVMKADRQVFGRVFIGTNGRGVFVGDSASGGGGSTAATPTFSPAAGTYSSAQTVTISDTTSGAMVYYTTNGTTPTTSSTQYTGPLTVSSTQTIKAIAAASGYSNSGVASAAYTISSPTAATPTFSPAAGTYTTAQSVMISDSTSGSTIYYTTNGSTPTSSSTTYTGPITVSVSETVKAIAVANGYTNSSVASAVYTISSGSSIRAIQTTSANGSGTSQVATFTSANTAGNLIVANIGDNAAGTITSVTDTAGNTYTQAVGLTCDSSSDCSTIWYASNIKASASNTVTVRYSSSQGWTGLDIAEFSGVGTLDKTATGTGNSASAATASVTTTVANELIVGAGNNSGVFTAAGSGFTWFGSSDGTGSEYKIVSATGSYNATGTLSSGPWEMQMATFYGASTPTAATPTFSPAAGTYTTAQTVTISDGTSGSTIYYTTNGTTPTTSSTTYSGPITVSSSETVKAIAAASGYTNSAVASAAYTISSGSSIRAIQTTSANGSGTSQTATFASANTAGDLIVANVADNAAGTVTSVTDTAGNTYTQAVGLTCDSSNDCSSIWYASNVKASTSNKVTAKFSSSQGWTGLDIAEFSGVSTLDKTATGTGNSAAAATASAITTAANELIVGAGNTTNVFTAAGSGFIWFGSSDGTGSEYKIVSATGSYSATGSLTSGPWEMQMATFR